MEPITCLHSIWFHNVHTFKYGNSWKTWILLNKYAWIKAFLTKCKNGSVLMTSHTCNPISRCVVIGRVYCICMSWEVMKQNMAANSYCCYITANKMYMAQSWTKLHPPAKNSEVLTSLSQLVYYSVTCIIYYKCYFYSILPSVQIVLFVDCLCTLSFIFNYLLN